LQVQNIGASLSGFDPLDAEVLYLDAMPSGASSKRRPTRSDANPRKCGEQLVLEPLIPQQRIAVFSEARIGRTDPKVRGCSDHKKHHREAEDRRLPCAVLGVGGSLRRVAGAASRVVAGSAASAAG
jgi:hypothetical protein